MADSSGCSAELVFVIAVGGWLLVVGSWLSVVIVGYRCCCCCFLQQPGPKKKIELMSKAKKFKVPPFTM